MRYRYNVKLEIKKIDDDSTKETMKTGEMTWKKLKDGSWKISRDWTEQLSMDDVKFDQ